jgi:glycosyltransferase involved in cell wall biosynthesis
MPGTFTQKLEMAGAVVVCTQEDFGSPTMDSFLGFLKTVQDVQPAIIHFNDIAPITALIVATLKGIRVVQHVRVADFHGYNEALGNADAIITVSEFVRAEVLKSDIPREKVHAILNGIDLETFDRSLFNKDLLRTELHIRPDAKVVLMVARFAMTKRHDVMVKAAEIVRSSIPDFNLVLVGEVFDESEYYDSIKGQVETLGLTDAVTFVDFQADIRKVEVAADVVVLCSDREPLGACVIEAMALEVPVVVTDSGGSTELVQDGKTGFVVPAGDADALADRIITLLSDHNLCRRLTCAARRHVEAELTAHIHATRVTDLYNKVLKTDSTRLV